MAPVAVPKKIIRCFASHPRVHYQSRADVELACWNWAMIGDNGDIRNITDLYDYVNGSGHVDIPVRDQAENLNELRAADHRGRTYPNLTGPLENELTAIRALWVPHRRDVYSEEKSALLDTLSARMARAVVQIYGHTVSDADTGIQIGMHFESKVVQRDGESDANFRERKTSLGVGFEHWWLRFKKKTVVETWVNLPHIQVAKTEQRHRHRTTWRAYVTGLYPLQIQTLTAIIQAISGGVPFVHCNGPKPWMAEGARQTCNWCEARFTENRRKHHCRSCGFLYCRHCASKSELVQRPSKAHPDLVPVPSVERVCDTCYTGND
jgi:hypothetical protein